MTESPIWHRQHYETDAAWLAFSQYFLYAEPPPGSGRLITAYRNWRRDRGFGGDLSQLSRVPGGWANWSQARHKRGHRIPGSFTWAERARAYDSHLAELAAEARAKRAEASRLARLALLDQTMALLDEVRRRVSTSDVPLRDYGRVLGIVLTQLRTEHDQEPAQKIQQLDREGRPADPGGLVFDFSELTKDDLLSRLDDLRPVLAELKGGGRGDGDRSGSGGAGANGQAPEADYGPQARRPPA